ncbi:hypothetical protein PENTCL1PPCAC_18405 [Pristionchus entomophagus]|uniref:Uncharacterized protein n=1 Tax=Pristionchus entomophagus TaxID=358040 RepID=A0AAV5TP80_9BILA|nr:hypothetical protein PENTCL1PPCAC_18405 [Pristionchus entomophagus]
MRSLVCLSLAAAAFFSFAAKTAEYNETLAVQLMHFAAATYGDREQECVTRARAEDSDWIIHSSPMRKCDIMKQECGMMIAHSESQKETVISFRGTKGAHSLWMYS